jgi:hypothetical protein
MSTGIGGIKRMIGVNGELSEDEPAGVHDGPVVRDIEAAVVKLDVVVWAQTKQVRQGVRAGFAPAEGL